MVNKFEMRAHNRSSAPVRFVHYLELKALHGQTKMPNVLLECKLRLEQFSGCTSVLMLKNKVQLEVFLLQSLWTEEIPALEWAELVGDRLEGWKLSEWSFEVVLS